MYTRLSALQAILGILTCAILITVTLLAQLVWAAEPPPSAMAMRIAERLERRLLRHGRSAPSVEALARAVAERQRLLASAVDVTLVPESGTGMVPWRATVAEHPQWVAYRISLLRAESFLDPAAVRMTVEGGQVPGTSAPVPMNVTNVVPDRAVLRAVTSATAQNGVGLADGAAEKLTQALQAGVSTLELRLSPKPAVIRDLSNSGLDGLSLLATGRSNFKGSDYGRIANVKKALTKHVHNVVVPAGAVFSFNETIEGAGGWQLAKIIVDGSLEIGPGGGICQASTTVFRGMLLAGLPVIRHRSHSLYVTYYEKYGVGLDATVFPGSQDLQFLNDTGHPLLLQSVINGWEAEVRVWGMPDGRKVTLAGPYFHNTALPGMTISGRSIRANEILWTRRVERSDGSAEVRSVYAQYRSLPRSITLKYQPETLHGAGL